jgi:hypothetical protein
MNFLKTTKCPKCGVQIETKHMKAGWLPIQVQAGFLGGKRVRFKLAACDCGEEYNVLMVTDGNNFKISDLIKVEAAKEATQPIQLEEMSREELIALAKELGIEGKIATFKTATLIEKIKEIQK